MWHRAVRDTTTSKSWRHTRQGGTGRHLDQLPSRQRVRSPATRAGWRAERRRGAALRAGWRAERASRLAAAALVGGGALRGLAEKSESFVMRRRGDRAVWRGERGDKELHARVQQRPRTREILKHRALMIAGRPPLPLQTGSQGGGHHQRRGRSSLSKFRASVR